MCLIYDVLLHWAGLDEYEKDGFIVDDEEGDGEDSDDDRQKKKKRKKR